MSISLHIERGLGTRVATYEVRRDGSTLQRVDVDMFEGVGLHGVGSYGNPHVALAVSDVIAMAARLAVTADDPRGFRPASATLAHRFAVGDRIKHVDGPGMFTVEALTWRRSDSAEAWVPTYTLGDPATGEMVDDVLCTDDLIFAGRKAAV